VFSIGPCMPTVYAARNRGPGRWAGVQLTPADRKIERG
jgi:hypothetical protein